MILAVAACAPSGGGVGAWTGFLLGVGVFLGILWLVKWISG